MWASQLSSSTPGILHTVKCLEWDCLQYSHLDNAFANLEEAKLDHSCIWSFCIDLHRYSKQSRGWSSRMCGSIRLHSPEERKLAF